MPAGRRPYGRRSIRLTGYDYTAPGAYFVTICTHHRECLFDNAVFWEVAENAWRNIPLHPHATHVTLDEWIVMPNHVHGILVLNERRDGWGEASGETVRENNEAPSPEASPLPKRDARLMPSSVGAIVGNYKSLVARRINRLRRTPGAPVWQRGYYDRIVRNQRALDAIRRYIRDNPVRWAEDRENLDALVGKMRRVRG